MTKPRATRRAINVSTIRLRGPTRLTLITGTSSLASQVSARAFLLGTFIGYLPQGVIAALIGSGVVDEKAVEGLGKLAAAGVVLLLGAFMLWRWRRGRTR